MVASMSNGISSVILAETSYYISIVAHCLYLINIISYLKSQVDFEELKLKSKNINKALM